MATPTTAQLKQALQLREQIDNLESQVRSLLNGEETELLKACKSLSQESWQAGFLADRKSKKRRMSPEGRARIVAAQKARWAKVKAKK